MVNGALDVGCHLHPRWRAFRAVGRDWRHAGPNPAEVALLPTYAVEVVDTREQWLTARDALSAQLEMRMFRAPTPMVTPYGPLNLSVGRLDGSRRLEHRVSVSGTTTFNGGAFYFSGGLDRALPYGRGYLHAIRRDGDVQHVEGRPEDWPAVRAAKEAIIADYQADGDHTPLRELLDAETEITRWLAGTASPGPWTGDNPWLQLASPDYPELTRQVALTLAVTDFCGSGQELTDTAEAVVGAVEQPRTGTTPSTQQ